MVNYTDGRKEEADIILEFEKAIETVAGQPGELKVPAEFITRSAIAAKEETKKQTMPAETKTQPVPNDLKKQLVADEIKKLFDLYKQGALTKEEFEAQKKKLLQQ
jgi:hypothetical protein